MKIWTAAVFLDYYCLVFVGGQQHTFLKGINGGKISHQIDTNNNPLPRSTLHEIDGAESLVQQSFTVIDEDETRHLTATQVTYHAILSVLMYLLYDYQLVYFHRQK